MGLGEKRGGMYLSSRMSILASPGHLLVTISNHNSQLTPHTPSFIFLHDVYKNSVEAVESVQKDGKICVLDIVSKVLRSLSRCYRS